MKFVKLIRNDSVEIENGGDLENIADRLTFKKEGSEDVIFETNAKYIMLTGVRGRTESNLPQVFLTVDPKVDKDDDESEVWDNLEIELETADEAESLMNRLKELMNQYKDDLEDLNGDSSSSSDDAADAGTGDEFINSLMA